MKNSLNIKLGILGAIGVTFKEYFEGWQVLDIILIAKKVKQ